MPAPNLPIEFARTLCLSDVFHCLEKNLQKRSVSWRSLPGLMTKSETFDHRMADVIAHKRAKVNFATIVKRFVRKRYPLWEFSENAGDFPVFENLPVARLNLRLLIERHNHWGLGKAFSLGLGVRLDSDDLGPTVKVDRNLFTSFGSGDKPSWCYVTAEDLEACLQAAARLLDQVLGDFERIAMKTLFPLPAEVPASIEVRGNLTARGAWEVARPIAQSRNSKAQLAVVTRMDVDLHTLPNFLVRDELQWNGSWTFMLLSPDNQRGVRVTVPNVGFVHATEFNPPQTLTHSRLGEDWIDSVRALELADWLAGAATHKYPNSRWSVVYELTQDPMRYQLPQSIWRLHYIVCGQGFSRHDHMITLDAKDGRLLHVQHY